MNENKDKDYYLKNNLINPYIKRLKTQELKNIEKIEAQGNTYKNPIDTFPCKFFTMIIILLIQAIMTHIIKPVTTFLEIILLTRITDIRTNEENSSSAHSLSDGVIALGWLILFLLPLINFFSVGIHIISIQKGVCLKIYVFILSLFEIYFQFPLTFMYTNNLHSVFLFDQRGLEQLLCPWLIFFPSDYIISVCEIIRQLVDTVYFFICGYCVYDDIKDNKYQAFNVSFLLCLLVLCAMKFVSVIVMIGIRVVKGNSEERGKRRGRSSNNNEIELETLKNTNEDDKAATNPIVLNEVKLDKDSNDSKEKKDN